MDVSGDFHYPLCDQLNIISTWRVALLNVVLYSAYTLLCHIHIIYKFLNLENATEGPFLPLNLKWNFYQKKKESKMQCCCKNVHQVKCWKGNCWFYLFIYFATFFLVLIIILLYLGLTRNHSRTYVLDQLINSMGQTGNCWVYMWFTYRHSTHQGVGSLAHCLGSIPNILYSIYLSWFTWAMCVWVVHARLGD